MNIKSVLIAIAIATIAGIGAVAGGFVYKTVSSNNTVASHEANSVSSQNAASAEASNSAVASQETSSVPSQGAASAEALVLAESSAAGAQGQPVPPRVTGQESAAGAQVILNEVNTDQYPQVRIFTTILKNGAPLRGLGVSDFRVREDEVDQEPLTVEPKLPPLSVVITLDTSGSMTKRLKETQAAAKSFLDTLGSNDSAQAVSFAREVKRLTTMSTNRQAARDAIGSTVARGDTALYDALYESVQLVKDRPGRKAIVLLSDGVDDDGSGRPLSKRTLREVIDLARTVNVPIYVLGLGTEIDGAVLTEVAKETGALYFNAPQAQDLTALYAQIGEQLAGQYAISYTSNLPADGTEHRVVLTSHGITDMKTYTAPGKAVAQESEQQTKVVSVSAGLGTLELKESAGCWYLFRKNDEKEVAHICGTEKRKLHPGVYTVKYDKKNAAAFEVTIEADVTTIVDAVAGTLELKESTGCWYLFRKNDEKEVVHICGTEKKKLHPGVYAVKYDKKNAVVFEVTIEAGVTTIVK